MPLLLGHALRVWLPLQWSHLCRYQQGILRRASRVAEVFADWGSGISVGSCTSVASCWLEDCAGEGRKIQFSG